MNLFEFLMILMSLIVGLGLAEILSGVARFLKRGGIRGFSWTHSAITVTVFVALLQTFWESWGLRSIEVWTFPAMLLMLGSPIILFLIAHITVSGTWKLHQPRRLLFQTGAIDLDFGGFHNRSWRAVPANCI